MAVSLVELDSLSRKDKAAEEARRSSVSGGNRRSSDKRQEPTQENSGESSFSYLRTSRA